jgi:ABC-2 type transport system ATP-binding protein
MQSPPPLTAQNLGKHFGKGSARTWAVRDISFQINQGEIVGLLGPNGAGKTTTIMMLISVLKPDLGSINIFGHDLALERSVALQNVSFASTYTNLPIFLSVQENLDIHARLYSIPASERRARIEELLETFGVSEHRHKRIGQLSAGQKTRVMLAKAFLSRPKLVFLDEPTASLDPDVAAEVRSFVAKQRSEHGTSVLFSSHNMAEVSSLCDRVIFLKKGEILALDTPENLAASARRTVVKFQVTSETSKVCNLLQQGNRIFSEQSGLVTIDTDQDDISALMMELARAEISFTDLVVDHPTLEDYFLLHS